ncbi:hypothetical protein [uncultured Draconibacterium sp.]|uniref:hypothetical protein n=1 Tax=uncultured Draconibacterium sp. TaxID=1573823 RepID=UPI002AA617EE|nr:hypothetical protein [uncultured Draconibacterium sp.]
MRGLCLTIVCFLIWGSEYGNAQLPAEKWAMPFYDGAVETPSISNLNDSVLFAGDSAGNPQFYFQDVEAEVCEDKLCFPVEITLFWDVAGEFLAFHVSENTPLTKADHVLFTKYDYYQLFQLLNSPDSKLARYKKADLVQHNRKNTGAVDAVSGATVRIAKEPMVNGAAFTCFSLWNIVYRQNPVPQPGGMKQLDKEAMEDGLENPAKLSACELTVLLNQAHREKKLRKLSVQKQLTAQLSKMNPLQCLLVSNYLNRQNYIYPEAAEDLRSCTKIERTFARMIP